MRKVDQKKLEDSILLLAQQGLISVSELSELSSLTANNLLREILSCNIPIAFAANAIPGVLVDDYHSVDREPDGGFILNSAFEIGTSHVFSRYLKPFSKGSTILNILEFGFSDELVFKLPKKKAAAFFDIPGIRLTPYNILISKIHAQKLIISPLIDKSSTGLASPHINSGAPSSSTEPRFPCRCCHPDYAERRTSWLMEKFFSKKKSKWKIDQQKKMSTLCGTFVELMADPPLGLLSRELIWEYEEKLKEMPANRYQAARRHGTNDANTLRVLAKKNGEELLTQRSVESYLDKLSSMFSWGVDNMLLTQNPAKRIIERSPKQIRDQDERARFYTDDLKKIFSALWFSSGRGVRNQHGRFNQFRPHYYWLPLLGLYTGARLNELSQLYLKDIVKVSDEVYYIDFNLDGEHKLDIDKSTPDKSLKTVDSKRIVPIHQSLIKLGLPEYVMALGESGYERLFPELKHDQIKGYGKPAGSWFNERFLGGQLRIPRDGMRTFHSFRHTFITALFELDMPSEIRSQLSGHSRGNTTTSKRYRKDAEADRLFHYIKQLDFDLPPISPFSVKDGIDAVAHALMRKTKQKLDPAN
jgi:integrase